MINFEYQNHTKMIFGKKTEINVGHYVKEYGTKVLFHYGSNSIKTFGLYERIVKSLQDASIEFVELGGVIANPSLDVVREGIELCRAEDVDFILAVGGGSVIDSAKAIAVGVFYDGDVWDFFTNPPAPKKALPIGTVLTIPAAGSESSIATIITNYQAGLKRGFRHSIVRPLFAIMNPEITYTLPAYQTAVGAIDMIGHVIERYFTNTTHVDLIDRMCEGLMRTVVELAPVVLKDPTNYDARAEIMLAGALAHNGSLGIGRLEDWACHNMEYEVTQVSGIAHGHGLAILYPAWMRYVYKHDLSRFALFAHKVFDIPQTDDLEQMAMQGINSLEAFYHTLGVPTHLKDIGIDETMVHGMANKVTNDGKRTIGSFVVLNKKDVICIYEDAL